MAGSECRTSNRYLNPRDDDPTRVTLTKQKQDDSNNESYKILPL